MIALRGPHVPQREARAIVARDRASARPRGTAPALAGCSASSPLTYCSKACSDGAGTATRRVAAGHDAPRHPLRRPRTDPSSLPRSAISSSARPTSIRIGRARTVSASPSTLHFADDHLRRRRRAAPTLMTVARLSDGIGRQVELIVGALARRARNRAEPARVDVVGDQDRDRLAQPVGATVAGRRFERHDENPAGPATRDSRPRPALRHRHGPTRSSLQGQRAASAGAAVMRRPPCPSLAR